MSTLEEADPKLLEDKALADSIEQPLPEIGEESLDTNLPEKLTLLAWLMWHWETAALATVLLMMATLLTFVLWPAPDMVLTLHELPATRSEATTTAHPSTIADGAIKEEAIPTEDEAVSSTTALNAKPHKSPHPHFTAKKPKHPPITSLNTATLAKLQLLPGIGPKMAQRVLEYRRSHGPFTDLAQIMEVKGIGPKKFEKMRPFIKL
jgi:competence ComEA-like helix-hairpin-helix protein